MDDAELVAAAADGEGAALSELARRHWGWLVDMLVGAGWGRPEAEDATQDAFAALHVHAGSIHNPAAVTGWLFTTAKRAASRSRTREVPTEHLPETPLVDIDAAPWASGESAVLAADERRRLRRAFRQLTPRDRQALNLRIVNEQPPDQVADALGVSPVAGRSVTSRAASRLGDWLHRLPALAPIVALRDWVRRARTNPAGLDAAGYAVAVASMATAVAVLPHGGLTNAVEDDRAGDAPSTAPAGQRMAPPADAPPPTGEPIRGGVAAPVTDVASENEPGPAADELVTVGSWDAVTTHDEPPPDADVTVTLPGDDEPFTTLYLPEETSELPLPDVPAGTP